MSSRGVRLAVIGAVAAIGWAPVAAALLALVYRFPVPFSSYASGVGGTPTAMMASVFYLVMGGVVVLGALGAAVGALLAKRAGSRAAALTVMAALGIAIVGATALALLEKVIGPW